MQKEGGQNKVQDRKNEQNAQQGQQQITPQTVQQFNKVCKQATQLMLSYKQQSQDLKNEITSMVTMYNKNANPSEAVPVDKIIQITNVYETQMKNAHSQYEHLEQELRKEEAERNLMVDEIMKCFSKLERMENIIKQKKARQAKNQPISVQAKLQDKKTLQKLQQKSQ